MKRIDVYVTDNLFLKDKEIVHHYSRRWSRVTCTCPSYIVIPMAQILWKDPVTAKEIAVKYPLRRMGKSEEIAQTVLSLASEEAS